MKYIIRANPGPGFETEPPSYWLPQHDGSYTRTGDRDQATARGFSTRDDARAFMEANGVEDGAANEIISIP
jgi:hypothetical protein